MSEPLSSLDAVLTEIADERARQDAKWGEQNHTLIDPVVASEAAQFVTWAAGERRESGQLAAARGLLVANYYRVSTANAAREACQRAASEGRICWTGILLEEFCEFLEAAALGDESSARQELVQLGAVAAAAIEAMDRRKT